MACPAGQLACSPALARSPAGTLLASPGTLLASWHSARQPWHACQPSRVGCRDPLHGPPAETQGVPIEDTAYLSLFARHPFWRRVMGASAQEVRARGRGCSY